MGAPLLTRLRAFFNPLSGFAPRRPSDVKLDSLLSRLASIEGKIERQSDDLIFVKRRLTAYLGDKTALTYLTDESPIFVNSNDFVGPINLISDGQYEEDNLELLLSYLKPDALFLDIGANLGFFSLKIAQRLRDKGRVMAFEPHPALCDLMRRTLFVNGLSDKVQICNFGLSDRSGSETFYFPPDSLGGGRLSSTPIAGAIEIKSRVMRLDQVLAPGTNVDLIKIDVEQHELEVLKGMTRTFADSPNVVVLFEKLERAAGYEYDIEALLASSGLECFAVGAGPELTPLGRGALAGFGGYVLAARRETVGSFKRARFTIWPEQLWKPYPEEVASRERRGRRFAAAEGAILFHGPYWFLRKGAWRISLCGDIEGDIELTIADRFGREVTKFNLNAQSNSKDFIAYQDLIHFECVARSANGFAQTRVERLDLERLG